MNENGSKHLDPSALRTFLSLHLVHVVQGAVHSMQSVIVVEVDAQVLVAVR